MPVSTGVPFLTEAIVFLKRQLVGFANGCSLLGQGRLARPAGVRLVDILTQVPNTSPTPIQHGLTRRQMVNRYIVRDTVHTLA